MKKLTIILAIILTFTLSAWAEDYKLTQDPNIVQRLSDTAFIPFAEGNRDYQAYLVWNETNDAQPADPVPVLVVDKNRVSVDAEIRLMTIERLKASGDIPQDYEE